MKITILQNNENEKEFTLGGIFRFSGVLHLRKIKNTQKEKIMRSDNETRKKNLRNIGHLP